MLSDALRKHLHYHHSMTDSDPTTAPIAAGPFGAWLAQAREALRGRGGMNVPCGDCVGCCTSHYSILLRPHDAALDVVPAALLSNVPGMWYPHAKMNPRADGTCPMFTEGRCSIYAQRPQTCLDYDCRVFAAAGLEAGADRPVINQRIHAWQFTYENEEAMRAHAAIQAAAVFIREHAESFADDWAPRVPAGIAALAIKVYELFLIPDSPYEPAERAADIMRHSRAFDATGAT